MSVSSIAQTEWSMLYSNYFQSNQGPGSFNLGTGFFLFAASVGM